MEPLIGNSLVDNRIPTWLTLLWDQHCQRASNHFQIELKHLPFRQRLDRENG